MFFLRTRIDIIYDNNSNRTSHDVESLLLDNLNGLDGYSNQFWIHHVIAFLGCTTDNAQLTTMIEALDEISSTWRRDRPYLSQGKDRPAIKNLSLFQSHPAALELICQVLAFRKKSISQEELVHNQDCMTLIVHAACNADMSPAHFAWRKEHDPTSLSFVEGQVSDAIQELLATSADRLPAHLDLERFQRFKRLYGWLGFRCRSSKCRNTNKVYTTDAQRQHHEKAHSRIFKCADCNSIPKGFKSTTALRKHRESYHMKPEDFIIPQSLVGYLRNWKQLYSANRYPEVQRSREIDASRSA